MSNDFAKESGATSKGPSAPTPTLPKGGGAIRSVGEKFAASAVTGTGSLNVPVPTSAARSGFQPQLSLDYDSGIGSGVFGAGWHLSVPHITRKTDRGLPRYHDREESDVFILSGMEDLVPERDAQGKPVVTQRGTESIVTYRPRVEGTFARIERHEEAGTANIYWTATTRDNVTSVYGKTAASQIADPAWPRRIFSWLLEQTTDDRGNVIVYIYKSEDLSNVAGSLGETSRLSGLATITNRYLKRIRYGNAVPRDATSTAFEVVFDYGEHDLTTPTPDELQAWPARQDPFSTYRAGFEVRTYRLCQRILMFHSFPELGATPCLVASTNLTFDENPILTKLAAITQRGYIRDAALKYTTAALPPLTFGYAPADLHTEIQTFEERSLSGVPAGVDGSRARWIDLDGEGIAGVLLNYGEAVAYKRNLGGAELAPPRTLPLQPSIIHLEDPSQQLVDLDSDGRKELAIWNYPMSGFHARTQDDGWEAWRPFRLQPTMSVTGPMVRFIDLTGDGHEDLLMVDDLSLTWFPSLGTGGYGPPIRKSRGPDEERGPPRSFYSDATQAIVLADMTGDGLPDIVRVRNGTVCYWPNLGYGVFGAKVTLAVPQYGFDRPDMFDPKRVQLGDIDGSGTTDVLYLHADGIRFYANQSGNSLATPVDLPRFPSVDDNASVSVIDLLGTGTGCLVWSSPNPGDVYAPMRYMDLHAGQKPHLLTSVTNNLGLTRTLEYASSTEFYLADLKAGRPWVTKLPFPVQVLSRVEVHDAVSETRMVTTYAYHHGYFDSVEREFRGFGMVEQWDAESFSAHVGEGLLPPNPNPSDPELCVPPAHTKTWFHTGAWVPGSGLSAKFAKEYYAGDPNAPPMPAPALPVGITSPYDLREASRALKGQILRQEIYAEDGTAAALVPYSVSERSHAVRLLQPVREKGHGVFLAFPREEISLHYERVQSDPRVTHAFTLEVDPYGVVTRSATVAYARRNTVSPDAQSNARLTLTETDVLHVANEDAWYRLGVPLEERTYELTGFPPGSNVLSFDAVYTAATTATSLEYDEAPTSGFQKRRLSQARHLYYANDLSGALAYGSVESLALPYESYAKAFRPAEIANVFNPRAVVGDAVLTEGGYVQLPGDDAWWAPSGRVMFSAEEFYLPIRFRDPFGNQTNIAYDVHHLLVIAATDALKNVVAATQDYRTLSPSLVTDPNGNRAEVQVDALGVVIATAVMGKDGSLDGDTLDNPTTTFDYDLARYQTKGLPAVIHSSARELHGAANVRFQQTYAYFDGMGREVMRKIQAEPGLAPQRDEKGALVLDAGGHLVLLATDPRWVGTGRVVLNNKGDPVKQYEPFFSSTHEYEDELDLVQSGVTPVLHYDPLGRLIRTDLPNGSYSKVEFDPWKQITWDPNDTVFDPASPATTQSLWYQRRIGLNNADPDHRAASLTASHAGTSTVVELDVLGHVFKTTQNAGNNAFFTTTLTLDIEGNTLELEDARGVTAMTSVFGMGGRKLKQVSSDAGTRWVLTEVQGKPLRSWDSRDHAIRPTYDELRRQLELFVATGAGPEIIAERTVWGEGHTDALVNNLRGKPYQHYDGAGVVTTGLYDFKGNLLTSSRRVAADYTTQPTWPLAGLTAIADIIAAAESLLAKETFDSATAYDALNRPTSLITPDASEIRPTYSDAGLLETVDVRVRGAASSTNFVSTIDYDAKGRRQRIVYGNGTQTAYTYDPLTFRLTRLRTTRTSDSAVLQDLVYTYDPIGNIVAIADSAQETVFFNNAVVTASALYEYDPLYRLISATGREHAGGIGDDQRDQNDVPLVNLPHASDSQALRNYTESYVYDAVGNILRMIHAADNSNVGSWTRGYSIAYAAQAPKPAPDSNRLLATSLAGDDLNTPSAYKAKYAHDAHGNMTAMPHLVSIGWTFKDEMQTADLGGGGNVYFTYDASGQRVRKVWVHAGLVEERTYLGTGYEVYRKSDSTGLVLERQTLHVMDDKQRIATVETKTIDTSAASFTPAPRVRFQLGNHLGSALLEVDETGLVISYEEYHPYGTTSYHSGRSGIEVSAKRYRYTGKEKDEETGLYYHGARYYACWLGRWTAADPSGMVDGPSLYEYVRGNPVRLFDPNGREGKEGASIWGTIKVGARVLFVMSGAEKAVRSAKEAVVATGTVALEAATALSHFDVIDAAKHFGEYDRNPAVIMRHQLRQADEKAALGDSQGAAIERARALLPFAALAAGVPEGGELGPVAQVTSHGAAVVAGEVAGAETGSLGPTLAAGAMAEKKGDGDKQPRKTEPPKKPAEAAKVDPKTDAVTTTEGSGRQVGVPKGNLDLSGPKAMEHIRRHAQHARETAVRLGLPRPETLQDVQGFVADVITKGEHRIGTWGTLSDAQFYRQGDAVVITRSNGQYVTNLDLSKGGSIVERWAEAKPPTQ